MVLFHVDCKWNRKINIHNEYRCTGYNNELRGHTRSIEVMKHIAKPDWTLRTPLRCVPPGTDRLCSPYKSLRQLQETDQHRAPPAFSQQEARTRSHSFHWLVSFGLWIIDSGLFVFPIKHTLIIAAGTVPTAFDLKKGSLPLYDKCKRNISPTEVR